MSEESKWFRLHHLPFALFILTMIVVVIGGSIRIYDAGESCPDWPQCFGTWGFDISEDEQRAWYDANPDEIDSRGSDYTYTVWEIFLEWLHRLVAGTILGPLCILQCFIAFRRRVEMPRVFKASSIALVLVIIQGVIGMITVKYDNIPWSVAIHLTFAMALALSLLWAWIRWMEAENALPNWMKIDQALAIRSTTRLYDLTISTLLVLIFGAFVSSSNGQNAACNVGSFSAWPLCNGSLFGDLFQNIQYAHRFVVIVVGAWLIWNVRKIESGILRKLLHSGIGIYVLNLLLGGAYILTWDNGFLEILSLLHLLLASLSFLCIGFAALIARNASIAGVLPEEE